MLLDFSGVNWVGVLVAVVAGQILLTLWFAGLFARPWAAAYGASDTRSHTAAIPPWAYGLGLASTLVITLVVALLHAALGLSGLTAGIGLGVVLGLMSAAAILPGYAFLGKARAGAIAAGSQVMLAVLVSAILSLF